MRAVPGTATSITSTGSSIQDGSDSSLKATVLDYVSSNPLAVRLTDTDGNYVAAGAGTQYTEGDINASITGGAMMWEDTGDTLRVVSSAKPLPVDITDTSVAVTGTFWQATQPISAATLPLPSGAATAANQLPDGHNVTIDNAGAAAAVNIQDGGNTITIDGTVTATATLAAETTKVIGTVNIAASQTIAVTNAGTFGVQVNGDALTALQLIDNLAVAVDGNYLNVNANIAGTDIVGGAGAVAAGVQRITLASDDPAVVAVQLIDDTVYVDDADWTDTTSKHLLVGGLYQSTPQTITDGDVAPLEIDANGNLRIAGTVTANLSATDNAVLDTIDSVLDTINAKLVTGTVIGDVNLGATDNAVLDTMVTALQLIDNLAVSVDGNYLNVNSNIAGTDIVGGAGAVAAGVQRVTLASDDPAVTSLGNLDNSVDGNYLNVNLNIAGSDVSATVPVPTKGVPSDIDINGSNANHAQKYYTNAGAVTDGIIWSPAAGKRWHILTLYINVSAAATVTLEDDLAGGDSAVWKGELAANSGVVLKYDKEHPFSSTEDAADLIITTSAGNIYVQAVGYEI